MDKQICLKRNRSNENYLKIDKRQRTNTEVYTPPDRMMSNVPHKSSAWDSLKKSINSLVQIMRLRYGESEEAGETTLLRAELDSHTRKVEKELDRELSLKLENVQTEVHRLRERVRELAEQNVSLQREVDMFVERELNSQSRNLHSDQQVKDLTLKMEAATKENQDLQQNLSELQDKCRAAEKDRDLFKRNYGEKDEECKELHRVVTRFLRTCKEQEKSIDRLREGLIKEVRTAGSLESNFDQNLHSKLQIEQLWLTGFEQALRKEAESHRLESDSLRHDNLNLLHRLKVSSKDSGFSTCKLNQELWSFVHCLQNQGTCLISDCVHLCGKLLENIKEKKNYKMG